MVKQTQSKEKKEPNKWYTGKQTHRFSKKKKKKEKKETKTQ